MDDASGLSRIVGDVMAVTAAVVLVRLAAARGLAPVVVLDRVPDRAAPHVAVPSPAAAPSPRMGRNRRKSLVPALVQTNPANAIQSLNPARDLRSAIATSPDRDPVPSRSVVHEADPSQRITNLVPAPTRTHAPGHDRGIVPILRINETSLAQDRPKTMTIHPSVTKAWRIRQFAS